MKHPGTADWIDALRYLIDATDAPQDARTDAQHALDTYNLARKWHADERQSAMTLLQSVTTMERELPATALTKVLSGKRPNLDTMLRSIDETRTAHNVAQQRVEIARRVEARCEAKVCGGALRAHNDTLLQWIGRRRHKAAHTCGEIDTLPVQVQIIHDAIRPTWSNQWDEALTLGTLTRLPLLYDATWTPETRASLAWVWEQVALGEIETVPHPGAHNTANAARVTLPTRRVLRLPALIE